MFDFCPTSYCEVRQDAVSVLVRLTLLSLVDIVKPSVAALVTINQKQYTSSYILIISDASPFLKPAMQKKSKFPELMSVSSQRSKLFNRTIELPSIREREVEVQR